MLALYNLCKLSRARQEQAALAGVLPLLLDLVEIRKDLRGYAFAMICMLTCASLASRKILWDQGGVAFFVRSLGARDLQIPALEALVSWLDHADWRERVETVLLKGEDFASRIIVFFRAPKADASVFVKILDPLLKLLRISRASKEAFANNAVFFQELVNRLKLEHKVGISALESNVNFNSINGFNALDSSDANPMPMIEALEASDLRSSKSKPPPSPHVRRLVSESAVSAGVDVRVRGDILRLLLLLLEFLSENQEQLVMVCQRHRLEMIIQHVLSEERKKQRVILCDLAEQILQLFEPAMDRQISERSVFKQESEPASPATRAAQSGWERPAELFYEGCL